MPNRPVQSDAAATGGETEEERGAEGRGVREQGGGQKGEKDLKEGWRWGGGGRGVVSHTQCSRRQDTPCMRNTPHRRSWESAKERVTPR